MKRETIIRLVSIAVIAVLVLIVIVQNTDDVRTKFLFLTIAMPRAVWMFVLFAAGVLTGYLVNRSRQRNKK